MAGSVCLSIITLNINSLSAPIKRHRVAEWIRKQDPYICFLLETNLIVKDTHRLNVKRWKKIFNANGKEKKAGVAILICAKIDFKIKASLDQYGSICWVSPHKTKGRQFDSWSRHVPGLLVWSPMRQI